MKYKLQIQNYKFPIGFFATFLSALFLRTYKLNLIPVFADEAIYVRWAQVMRAEPSLRFLPLSDGKQPLFMWTVMPALKIISDPLIAGRVVSVLTGLGTAVGVAMLGYVLFKSKRVAILSALLYALSPFAVFFDRMALVDSMLSFFGVWMLVLLILAVKKLNLGLAFLAGFALGGALLTKSPALFFLILAPSVLLLSRKIFHSIGLVFSAMLMGFVMYNILRLGENFHMIGLRNYDYVFPYSRLLTSPLDPLIPHLERVLSWFEVTGPIALFILIVVGLLGNFRKYKKEVLVLLAFGVLPILVQSEYAKVFTSRYIFFTLPPLIVLGASSLMAFGKPVKIYGVYALVILFVIESLLFHISFFKSPETTDWPEHDGYLSDWTAGTGIKEAAEIIKASRDANPEKHVVVGTEGYFGTLPDGLQIYLEKEPNITVIGVGLDIKEIPASLKESAKAGNINFLVANASRLKFARSFDEYDLKIVASWEKAEDKLGKKDVFYLFEL